MNITETTRLEFLLHRSIRYRTYKMEVRQEISCDRSSTRILRSIRMILKINRSLVHIDRWSSRRTHLISSDTNRSWSNYYETLLDDGCTRMSIDPRANGKNSRPNSSDCLPSLLDSFRFSPVLRSSSRYRYRWNSLAANQPSWQSTTEVEEIFTRTDARKFFSRDKVKQEKTKPNETRWRLLDLMKSSQSKKKKKKTVRESGLVCWTDPIGEIIRWW